MGRCRESCPQRDILRLLKADKKTRDGVVHFVLPREIGKVDVVMSAGAGRNRGGKGAAASFR